jgi:hypothetical protein
MILSSAVLAQRSRLCSSKHCVMCVSLYIAMASYSSIGSQGDEPTATLFRSVSPLASTHTQTGTHTPRGNKPECVSPGVGVLYCACLSICHGSLWGMGVSLEMDSSLQESPAVPLSCPRQASPQWALCVGKLPAGSRCWWGWFFWTNF